MTRAALLIFLAAVFLLVLLAMSLERDRCPEGEVWVLGDGKWVCVKAGV
jgi:hypothetical protein